MIQRIPIEVLPNQSLEVLLGGRRYSLSIKCIGDSMAITIVRDDVTIIEGLIIPANEPLIPYKYLEDGNFVMRSDGDEIPYYENFGSSVRLLWVSQDELEQISGSN